MTKSPQALLIVPLAAAALLFLGFVVAVIHTVLTDPFRDMYKDRIEYPLASVDINDTSDYMLLKWQHSPETYEIVTDTQAIKDNALLFSVDNAGSLYGTTPDGSFNLYKDGEHIGSVPFDQTLTRSITYGTLQFQRVNPLQFQLLMGHEIIEQGQHYAVLFNRNPDKPSYDYYAHSGDLHDLETVSLVLSGSSPTELPQLQARGDFMIEFTAPYSTYAGEETQHWYYRLSDGILSQRYLNVKAVTGTLIAFGTNDPRIVICDIFDKDGYTKKLKGDFSQEKGRLFLINAEFTGDDQLSAEYIGSDGQPHREIFALD